MFDLDKMLVFEVLSGIVCGFCFGFERQLRGKPVGIRTSVLIVLSTITFVHVSKQLTGAAIDQSRIIGQVVTGVGFLGAGVIFTQKGLVVGMTSAAVIWALAAIGCAIGYERFTTAYFLTVICVGTLVLTRLVERSVKKVWKNFTADDAE